MLGTIKMLENLAIPVAAVPRCARLNGANLKGTGYPRKLTADALSIPERILVISDILASNRRRIFL